MHNSKMRLDIHVSVAVKHYNLETTALRRSVIGTLFVIYAWALSESRATCSCKDVSGNTLIKWIMSLNELNVKIKGLSVPTFWAEYVLYFVSFIIFVEMSYCFESVLFKIASINLCSSNKARDADQKTRSGIRYKRTPLKYHWSYQIRRQTVNSPA